MSEKMDYRAAAKEFQERLCGEARANTEKLWWASTKFPEELAAWVSALLDKVRQAQAADDAAAINRWADGWEQRIKSGMYQGEILGAADILRDEGRDLAKHFLALAALRRK